MKSGDIMFKTELSLVPKKSGCYLMKNDDGVIIYVGKAKILFNRLKSYFTGTVTGKTRVLVDEIKSFEYIVTTSELEAFILELNLIKKYNPKYNILLKDDKSYPYIELTNEKYPRLIVRRELNISKKKKLLFGPYPNAYAARRIVHLINRIYPLKKCVTIPKKECLYYHIHECLGYCIHKDIDITDMKNEIISILNGNDEKLIEKIKEKIEFHSSNLNYEQALELKKELDYIGVVFERQKVELNDGINRDIFNYYVDKGYISIEVFFLRNGKLVGSNSSIKPIISNEKDEVEYYIMDFYEKKNIVPREIIVPLVVDTSILSELLKSKVINIQKGIKKKILDMAYDNAKINLENEIETIYRSDERSYEANNELKEILNLDKLHTIEIFDNSNLFGSFSVSAMVVFVDGLPSKKEYRKFKLSFEKNDDVASMKEVIYRRYFKLIKENIPLPDLIIVDGGINQINACKSVLNDFNLNIKVCGLKKNDKHKTNELIDGDTLKIIEIDKRSNAFYLLSRIGDEVHRFAISYHKQIRSKSTISSLLDSVPGIGEKRKKELINKFGSLKKIKEIPLEELETIIPSEIAKNLKEFLNNM
jgi:excinuclease ABC subunit C